MPLLGDSCYDIYTLPYTFDHIWTNLLTQCTPVPVSVFCCFCISVFPITRTARKIPEKLYKKSAFQKVPGSQSTAGGGHQGSRRPGGAAPPGRAGGGAPGPPKPRLMPPFGIYLKRLPKPSRRELFFAISSLFRRRRRFQDREHQENSSRHPAGGEDHHREPLHHHGRLPDEL